MRNDGTKNEWMTSREVMSRRTGRCAGTRSTFTPFGPSGYENFHIHCLAITYTSIEFSGGVLSRMKSRKPMANQSRKKNVGAPMMIVSSHHVVYTGSPLARRRPRQRYLM